jgi:hypothetical protein
MDADEAAAWPVRQNRGPRGETEGVRPVDRVPVAAELHADVVLASGGRPVRLPDPDGSAEDLLARLVERGGEVGTAHDEPCADEP